MAINGAAAAGRAGPDGTPASSVEWPAAAAQEAAQRHPEAAADAHPAGAPGPAEPTLPTLELPGFGNGNGDSAPAAAPAGTDALPAHPRSPLDVSGLPEGFTMREDAAQTPLPPQDQAPVPAPVQAQAQAPAQDEAPDQDQAQDQGQAAPAAPRPPAQPEPDPQAAVPEPPAAPDPAATDPRTVAHEELPAPAADVRLCVFCGTGQVGPDDYCGHCGKAQPRERDHMEQELGAVAAVSNRGLRHHRNEDAFAVSSTALKDGTPAVIAVVCDGVSSATRPDDASMAASRAANESLLDALPRGRHPQLAMHEAILAASDAVNALADEPETQAQAGPNQNAPACTLVGAIVAKDLLIIGWIGDSRAYWVPVDRTATPARLTEDDSWAAQMVASGLMNEAEAYADERAHAITGWLGADAYELTPHTASYKPDQPGTVVVCTDGLWNYAEGAGDMMSVLPPDASEHPLGSARALVGHALEGGGHDNVTVAILPFPVPLPAAGGDRA
jgi:serine/threonine protein phosphatase PrpC